MENRSPIEELRRDEARGRLGVPKNRHNDPALSGKHPADFGDLRATLGKPRPILCWASSRQARLVAGRPLTGPTPPSTSCAWSATARASRSSSSSNGSFFGSLAPIFRSIPCSSALLYPHALIHDEQHRHGFRADAIQDDQDIFYIADHPVCSDAPSIKNVGGAAGR